MKLKSIKKAQATAGTNGKISKNKQSFRKKKFVKKSSNKFANKKAKSQDSTEMNIERKQGNREPSEAVHSDAVTEDVFKLKKDLLDDDSSGDEDLSSSEEMGDDDQLESAESHKQTLERLKEKDPEFYQYLKQNDQELLEFDDQDDLGDVSDGDDGEIDDTDTSPESNVSLAKIAEWRAILQNPSSSNAHLFEAIKSIIKVFRKVVGQTLDEGCAGETADLLSPNIFNAVINSTLLDLLPALMKYLRLQSLGANKKIETPINDSETTDEGNNKDQDEEQFGGQNSSLGRSKFFDPRRSRNWKRIQPLMKFYLTDVLKMMTSLSSDARASFERHVLELTPFFNVFPHLVKRLIKRSITEWSSSGDNRNRVLAFLILHRMIRVIQSNDHLTSGERQTLINQILRKLYLCYVGVAKSTNEMTLAQINFMKNSLVELYGLDHFLAYQHSFIFIRQLAISLRNSMVVKHKVTIWLLNICIIFMFFFFRMWSKLCTIGSTFTPFFCGLNLFALFIIKVMCSIRLFRH